jgi:DNA-binding CsgD family transcriptional regulator/preprotein translocase subunit YajC
VNPSTIGLSFLFSLAALIVSIFSFFYFRSYLKRRTSQERILSELQNEVDLILKSINEITERDITLIEDREKELKGLLTEIEKRLKTYIRELDQARNAEEVYQELGKNRYKISKQAAESEKAAEREKAPETGAAFPLPDFDLKPEPESSLSIREQIHSLLRSGLSDAAIAFRLGISIAEVEFAAALLERRGSVSGSVE